MKYCSALKILEENLAVCNDVDESGRHYAKRNKPVTRGQILHDCS